MRILKLTPRIEKSLLSRRAQRDVEANSVASEIVADVRKRGDPALFAWTKKLDHVDLARDGVWIPKKEIRAAGRHVSPEFLGAVKRAARNVRRVAEKQLPRAWTFETEPGVRISQRVSPIESIGCYIPGGHFSLVSTLVMTAVPAEAAGISRIVAVCPKPNPELLAAAALLGIREIARIGGAQAIAALAYGTKSIPSVEKIFGPGNKYVTTAKQLVSGIVRLICPRDQLKRLSWRPRATRAGSPPICWRRPNTRRTRRVFLSPLHARWPARCNAKSNGNSPSCLLASRTSPPSLPERFSLRVLSSMLANS